MSVLVPTITMRHTPNTFLLALAPLQRTFSKQKRLSKKSYIWLAIRDKLGIKMSEPKVERKVVSRTVAISLGIICIVLVIGLVGAIAEYTSMINDKDNTISSQASQISSYQNQVSDLTGKLDLSQNTVWINDQPINQGASGYTYWTFSATYAGYVVVNVISSTTSNAYAEVIYSSNGVNYDSSVTVGYSGTASFAVLPSGSIQVRVGNSNWINSASETVTITYYY
jgi:hypothetical protein